MENSSEAELKSSATLAVLTRFNDVFLKRDPGPLQQLVAEDCTIQNSQPAPDGALRIGKAACIDLWANIATNPDLRFEPEDIVAAGDLGIVYWKLFIGADRHIRGVNIMRIADRQIVEARGYVKAG